MGQNRYIHLMFILGAAALSFLFLKTGEWALGYVMAKPPEAPISAVGIALGCTVAAILYRNERVFELASDVINELRKVTWPTGKETRSATVVVIVTVLVFAVVLGLYDAFWSWVTTHIYS